MPTQIITRIPEPINFLSLSLAPSIQQGDRGTLRPSKHRTLGNRLKSGTVLNGHEATSYPPAGITPETLFNVLYILAQLPFEVPSGCGGGKFWLRLDPVSPMNPSFAAISVSLEP